MALGTDRRSVLTAVLGGLAVSGAAAPAHAGVLDPPALQKADTPLADIDALAVTHGPGLVGALLV